ncbi:MAG: stalk domain-containing protein [Peptoniphilus sp.]|nr:stalk domain-containing protein [Peptoniphilus sp.]MDD7363012.1 stalk domain-containing protein [Bacillota bacterium]MDY6045277.1 stalk domain-containing protein [Peptoniphilus sp.]
MSGKCCDKIRDGGDEPILRNIITTVCLLCSLLLTTGAGVSADSAALFDGVKQQSLALERPEAEVSVERFVPKTKETVPVELKHPLRVASGNYFLALSDLQAIVGKDKVTYSRADQIVTIHQINRVQMALDRPAYVKQSGRAKSDVYPTYADGILYVPMRFMLEEMGYTVNASGEGHSIVISPDRAGRKVVALRQIDVDGITPYRDGTMATKIFDVNGADFLAWGEKVPGNLATVYRIGPEGKIRYTRQLALEEPRGYDARTKTAVAMDPFNVYLYRMSTGAVETIPRPYSMKDALDVRSDGDILYFKTPEGIFSYDPNDKSLKKDIDRAVDRYEVSNGRIACLKEGALSVSDARGTWFLPESGDLDFILDDAVLVVDDLDLGLCRVYDLESRRRLTTAFYDRDKPHSLRLVSGRYLALGQENTVRLVDILSNAADDLDLINIEPAIDERRVEWFWNGNVLRGYVDGEGKKIAQNITVRHP